MLCIQSKCPGSKVSWVGVFFFIVIKRIVDTFKIRVRNSGFTAYHHMTFIGKVKRKPGKSVFHVSNICSYSSVSAGKDFR